jgi:hypothetical protein
MQIENDYDKEVYNGDIGYIDDVDPNPPCCSGTFSTPASPEVSGWSFWLGRRKPSPSPFVMPPDGAGGRSWRNG